MKGKVLVGLSGGVDSSVAASLLIKDGYEVHAAYLECYNEPGCRTDQDKADALKVALQLGISFEVIDFRKEYKEKVIEYFYQEYEAGRTPNPDVVCNREIKFGLFYTHAMNKGFDYVATGHYARIAGGLLQRARDESKDQSYFLWQIPSDHLEHILFPLGNHLKREIRKMAREMNLPTAEKPDSMGICFIGDVDTHKLLRDRLGEQEGEVIMKIRNKKSEIRNKSEIRSSNSEFRVSSLEDDHVVIGRHKGLWFYTIGERGGWEMLPGAQTREMKPLYVIDKDPEKNVLLVGNREQVMTRKIRVARLKIRKDGPLWVRIRNLGELHEVLQIEGDIVTTRDQVFGVASGQSAVFYDFRGILVDGAIIV